MNRFLRFITVIVTVIIIHFFQKKSTPFFKFKKILPRQKTGGQTGGFARGRPGAAAYGPGRAAGKKMARILMETQGRPHPDRQAQAGPGRRAPARNGEAGAAGMRDGWAGGGAQGAGAFPAALGFARGRAGAVAYGPGRPAPAPLTSRLNFRGGML